MTAGILLSTSSAVAYTKYYAIKNYTNTAHTHARVTLMGIEIITETCTGPESCNQPQLSYPSQGGSTNTCIWFGDSNNPQQPDELVFLKWTTSDNHCQLAERSWAWLNPSSVHLSTFMQVLKSTSGGFLHRWRTRNLAAPRLKICIKLTSDPAPIGCDPQTFAIDKLKADGMNPFNDFRNSNMTGVHGRQVSRSLEIIR